MLRLDQQSENNRDTRVIGTLQTPKTPVIRGQFIATSTADEAMTGILPTNNQAVLDITRLLELKTAIQQACDIVPIQP
jgi:hypothetical protein